MRWPWQSPSTDTHAQTSARRDHPSPDGWAFFPPIQRIVGEQPTLTRTDAFTRSLPAWGNPSSMGAMSHLVSVDGPSGVVDADGGGLGAPQPTAYTPELPLFARVTSPAARGAESLSQDEDVTSDLPVVPTQSVKAASESPSLMALPPAGRPSEQPLYLHKPVPASRSSNERDGTESSGPASPVGPTVLSNADPRFNENATNDGNATIVSLPTARPLQRQSEEPVARPVLSAPGERRLGLGQPFVPGAEPLPSRSPTGPMVQHAGERSLPLAPTPTAAADTSTDSRTGTSHDEPAADSASISLPERVAAPSTSAEARRAVEPGDYPGRAEVPRSASTTSSAGLLSTQRLITAGLESPLAPRASSSAGTPSSGPSRLGHTGSRSSGVIQRATVLAPGWTVADVGSSRPSTREATPEEIARSSSRPASSVWTTQSSAATPARNSSASNISPAAITPPVIQRNFGGLPLALPSDSGVRDAVSSAESTAIGEESSAPSSAANAAKPVDDVVADAAHTAANAAAPGGAGGSSPQDVDALAEKLMIPLLRRFKSEMLLDRERRGLRTDTF